MSIKVYQRENSKISNDYVLEIWGASTKHPDVMFFFSDFKKTEMFDERYQIFQWLLECASKLTMPTSACELAEYAIDNWRTWRADCPNYIAD